MFLRFVTVIIFLTAISLNAESVLSPLLANENINKETENRHKNALSNQELRLKVSLKDVFIDETGIFVNINRLVYPVNYLEKIENQWFATIINGLNYCPQGHPTCKGCGLCHKEDCWYYVKPCKLW